MSHEEINDRVDQALGLNLNYRKNTILGVPASYLDEEEFYDNAPFLEDAPFLKTFIANPNHIGCHTHTREKSEPFFQGTQKIEIELIDLIAEEIFKAEPNSCDGYVSPGGTEANIQAMWVYRNYFQQEHGAKLDEIALIYSADSHYSLPKGANLLGLNSIIIDVDFWTRKLDLDQLKTQIQNAQAEGVKHFIVFQNLATTMFGSIDPIEETTAILKENNASFRLHVDGAFGGFVYPFAVVNDDFSFKNPDISSFTLDGHKMLQTPYGTGIFMIRRGMMQYAETPEASYVHGKDFTICGSRSGANAISIWMTLMIHGSMGWQVKVERFLERTSRFCSKLDKANIRYFRNPNINIAAICAQDISADLARAYHLVADNPDDPKWWKIVVMDHVAQGVLDEVAGKMV